MFKAICATLIAFALHTTAVPVPSTLISTTSTPSPQTAAEVADVGALDAAGSSFEATLTAMNAETALFEKCQLYFEKCQNSSSCSAAGDVMAAAIANARARSGEPATPQLHAIVLGNLGMSSEEGARLFWCLLGLHQPSTTLELEKRLATVASVVSEREAAGRALALDANSKHSELGKARRRLRFLVSLGSAVAAGAVSLAGSLFSSSVEATAFVELVEAAEVGAATAEVGTMTAEVGTMTEAVAAGPSLLSSAFSSFGSAVGITGTAVGAVLTFQGAKDLAFGDGLHLIRNTHGICLDSPEGWKAGGKVHMWDCNPRNSNQHWIYSADTKQIRNKYADWNGRYYCLDASERSTRGGKVHMWPCSSSNQNQWWLYDPESGLIKNAGDGGICLDASERSKNGGKVHMWTCDSGNKNQQWDITFEPSRRARAETATLPCWVNKSVEECRAQEEL